MIRRPPRSTQSRSSAASDVYKRQVEDLVTDRRLVLHAEMRLPGEAWLEWTVEPDGIRTRLRQTARFRPRGLLGRIYWYAVAPFHRLVFPGIIRGIAHDATQQSETSPR